MSDDQFTLGPVRLNHDTAAYCPLCKRGNGELGKGLTLRRCDPDGDGHNTSYFELITCCDQVERLRQHARILMRVKVDPNTAFSWVVRPRGYEDEDFAAFAIVRSLLERGTAQPVL